MYMYVNICIICILYIYTDIFTYFSKSMQLFLFLLLSINYITPTMDILEL